MRGEEKFAVCIAIVVAVFLAGGAVLLAANAS
jgi:hypothetical protein